MQLNLPIFHLLQDKDNILISGAGGGFDIFAGLPLYFTLKDMGKTVHLANYSFTDFAITKVLSDPHIEIPDVLLSVTGEVKDDFMYYPEGHLGEWLAQNNDHTPVWLIRSHGTPLVEKAFERLVQMFNIDALILVDGGVDSIMRGDEHHPGSLLEDTITLAAVENIDIPVKLLACLGFGSEVEEGVCHYTALENMAGLVKAGGFYGSCALTPQMSAFQRYEQACRHAWESGKKRHKSHISTRIIPAVHGEFGDFHMYTDDEYRFSRLFISPLMSLYWFFDAQIVADNSYLTDDLRNALTKEDAMQVVIKMMMAHRKTGRPRREIPY